MIKQHFQDELIKFGYPNDLTIEYSLGYCQGDGVAFYGSLNVDSIKALFDRFFSTDRSKVDAITRVKNLMDKKAIEEITSVIDELGSSALSITRNSYGHRYSHWNCMNINDNVECSDLLQDNLLEIWLRFVSELEQDVINMSKMLEENGYKLRESMPDDDEIVCERTTKKYIVRVIEIYDEDFNMDDWSEEQREQTTRSILEGKERVIGLRVEVLSRENEIVLGEDSIYGLIIASDDKTYGGYKRELLQGAIYHARHLVHSLNVA